MTRGLAAASRFLYLFRWFSLRHLGRYWPRTVAVLLGIALGAAVFTSVRLAVHATIDSFSDSMNRIAGNADLTVARPGGWVSDGLVAKLIGHPLVDTASPVLSAYVRPAGRETPFLLVGFDPILDRPLRSWSTASPQRRRDPAWAALMARPGTLIITDRLGKMFRWEVGQAVRLVHARRSAPFTILDRLDSRGLALAEGGRIALCDIATFQEFTGLFGKADRIDVKLKAPPSDDAEKRLASLLPTGAVLGSPSAQGESGRGMIRAYELSLTFLSFISLFVGMFLVFSLVALNAAARRGELAVMRATGASRSMIFALFVGEGAFIGLVGWLLSLPISGVLVNYLLTGVSRTVSLLFVRVLVDRLALSPWEVALSFGVTLTVAILAALQPAREAMGVAPAEALDRTPDVTLRPGSIRKMAIVGTGLLFLVYPLSRLPSPPAVSLPGYLAALLLFVGFALLAPLLLRQTGRLLAPWLLRHGGQPAFLAAGYLKESGVQTAISVGALITAVALFSSLAIMIHSFRGTVSLWVDQSIAGDLYVRPKLAGLNGYRDPLPPEAVAAVEDLPVAVQRVPMRRFELQVGGHRHLFQAMDMTAYTRRNRFVWMAGDSRRIEADLTAGKGVAVSEVFANKTGLTIGDRYRALIDGRPLDEPIIGLFRDYRTRGGMVYYALSHYRRRFGDDAVSGVQLNFPDGGTGGSATMDRVRAALVDCCGQSIEMEEGPALRRTILLIFDETFAITTVLLLIALVVAALGIATTLAVVVLQRRVQINTIRAVGGTAGQLRRMIVWEAGLIILAGQAGGYTCGFILSSLLIFVVNRQSFGWTFLYRVDWISLFTAVPLIFLAGLLAALPAVKLAQDDSPARLLRGGIQS